jgi:hypothetical protein
MATKLLAETTHLKLAGLVHIGNTDLVQAVVYDPHAGGSLGEMLESLVDGWFPHPARVVEKFCVQNFGELEQLHAHGFFFPINESYGETVTLDRRGKIKNRIKNGMGTLVLHPKTCPRIVVATHPRQILQLMAKAHPRA